MVHRFDCFEPQATGHEKGEYVRYSDYAELEVKIERLTKDWESAAKAAKMRQNVIDAMRAEAVAVKRREDFKAEPHRTKSGCQDSLEGEIPEGPAVREFRRIFHKTRFTRHIHYEPELIAAVLEEIGLLTRRQ